MFPEPYRTQAIENTIALSGTKRLEIKKSTAASAIMTGFAWDDSPEKETYWWNFKRQLDRNEIVLAETSEGGKP